MVLQKLCKVKENNPKTEIHFLLQYFKKMISKNKVSRKRMVLDFCAVFFNHHFAVIAINHLKKGGEIVYRFIFTYNKKS